MNNSKLPVQKPSRSLPDQLDKLPKGSKLVWVLPGTKVYQKVLDLLKRSQQKRQQ